MQFARLSVFAALLSSSTLLYAAPQYSLSLLSSVNDYPYTYTQTLNNAGVVSGHSYTYNFDPITATVSYASNATIWTNGTATALSGHGTPNSQALASNLNGQTVGVSWTVSKELPPAGVIIEQPWPRYDGKATIWSNGTATTLSGLHNEYGYANGINNHGQIVGWSLLGQDKTVATLWNSNNPVALAGLTGYATDAYAINDQGIIVGTADSYKPGDMNYASTAVYWNAANEIHVLQGISAGNSGAYALNENGILTGWSTSADNHQHATIWVDGQAVDLGRLGGYASYAYAINNQGDVVGSYVDDTPGIWGEYAVIWKNGVATNLNTLVDLPSGVELYIAQDINDAGYIIAQGYDAEGRWASYLLSPVPEPSSYALMLAGLALIGVSRRKR